MKAEFTGSYKEDATPTKAKQTLEMTNTTGLPK
jgi:hypothetical protein